MSLVPSAPRYQAIGATLGYCAFCSSKFIRGVPLPLLAICVYYRERQLFRHPSPYPIQEGMESLGPYL